MNDLLAAIKAQAQEMAGELSALRRDFHQHPELSHQEERTARVIAAYLTNLGLKVRTGLAGHGVVADLKGVRPGPIWTRFPSPRKSRSPGAPG